MHPTNRIEVGFCYKLIPYKNIEQNIYVKRHWSFSIYRSNNKFNKKELFSVIVES